MVLPTPLTPIQVDGANDSAEIQCLFLEGDFVGKTLLVSLNDPNLDQAVLDSRVVIPGPLTGSPPSPIEPELMFIVSVDPAWAFAEAGVVIAATIDNLLPTAVLKVAGVTGTDSSINGDVLTATFDLSAVEDIGVSTIGVYTNAQATLPEHEIEFEIQALPPIEPPVTESGYWRIIPVDSLDLNISVADIQMFSSVGGPNEFAGGEARVQFNNVDGVERVTTLWTDGAQNTLVTAAAGFRDSMRLTYHRPADPFIGNRIRIAPANASVAFKRANPTAMIVRRSEDNVNYRTTDLILVGAWSDDLGEAAREFDVLGEDLEIGLGRSNARGWGINILSTVGTANALIANLIFAAAPGGAQICVGGSPTANRSWAYGTGSFNDRSPRNAFDGNASTRWMGVTGNFPQRLGYLSEAPLGDATEVRIQATATAGELNGMPASFEVWYTEDLVTRNVVATITGQGAWSVGEIRAFPV